MTAPKRNALGRGLGALLDENNFSSGVSEVDIMRVEPSSDQPRKTFDPEKLSELAQSIKRHGVVQPILVKRNGPRYTIVAGERRYRAARMAGLMSVPVVTTDIDEDAVMEISLVENIQRENLNPIEEAAALKLLMLSLNGRIPTVLHKKSEFTSVGAHIRCSGAMCRSRCARPTIAPLTSSLS